MIPSSFKPSSKTAYFPASFGLIFATTFLFTLFVGSLVVFKGFAESYRLSSDCLILFGALVITLSLLLTRGLAPFYLASRSVLAPYFFLVGLVQVVSAFATQAPTALQTLTIDWSYILWIVGAIALWTGRQRKILFFLVVTSLVITFAYDLFKFKQKWILSPPHSWQWSDVSRALYEAIKYATFRYPFKNPNFSAGFVGPLIAGVWAVWAYRAFKVPGWFLFLTLPMIVFVCISKAMTLILFAVYWTFLMTTFSDRWRRSLFLILVVCFCLGAGATSTILLFTLLVEALLLSLGFYFLKRGKILVVVVPLILALGGFVVCLEKNVFSQSAQKGPEWLEKFVYDKSAGIRLLLWSGVWRGVMHADRGPLSPWQQEGGPPVINSPGVTRLVGLGPGTYLFQSGLLRQAPYYSGAYASDYTHHPHSSVFSFMAETGLAGVVVWSALFVHIFLLIWRYIRLPGRPGLEARVLLAVASVLALHSLVSAVPHYPMHRLLWVLVIGGVLYMELKHRQFFVGPPKIWPKEFAGPLHAIGVGLILFLCAQGFYILQLRWQILYFLDQTVDSFGQWHKEQNKGKNYLLSQSPLTPLNQVNDLDQAMRRAEKSLLEKPGSEWVNINVIKTLKLLALARENYKVWAQIEDPQRGQWWRVQTFVNLRRALAWAPGFTDLSRLYGEILWKVAREAELSNMDSFVIDNQNYSLAEAQAESAAWMRYSFIKGSRDYVVFNTLFNQSAFESLRKRVQEDLKRHPIFHPVFKQRLMEGAKIRGNLQKAWIRWQLQFGEKSELDDVFLITYRYLRDKKPKGRYQSAHLFAIDLLRRQGHVPLKIMEILKIGGPSADERRNQLLFLPPGSYGWLVETLRTALFVDPEQALALLDEQAQKQPESKVFESLASLIRGYLLTSNKFDHF